MMFKFFREDEVILHAFVCLPKEGGELRANGGKIIEGVQLVNDEGSARLSALELFLPEIEPTSLTEFIGYTLWSIMSGLSFPCRRFFLMTFFLGLKMLELPPTGHNQEKLSYYCSSQTWTPAAWLSQLDGCMHNGHWVDQLDIFKQQAYLLDIGSILVVPLQFKAGFIVNMLIIKDLGRGCWSSSGSCSSRKPALLKN
jgi:hypothetical protein